MRDDHPAQPPSARREIGKTLLAAIALIGVAGALFALSGRGAPSPSPLPSPPRESSTPARTNRIGILAGHWQYDGGANCGDGVYEADLTYQIAQKIVPLLSDAGYEVDILAEHDPRLEGYQADALVALHIDSCVPGLSGYKVARSMDSFIPQIEDRLVECLYGEYEEATGLPRHETTVTLNMLGYYALVRIAPQTPGAIIELGFMADDAQLLRNGQERVAHGVAQGLLCFLA